MTKKESTKRLAVCAMLSALGVVLLLLGSFFELLDLSMALLASLPCATAVTEYRRGWLVFAVTAVLSLILLPVKTPAVAYLLFFGYYPIVKQSLEKKPRLLAWLLKELVFHLSLGCMLIAGYFLLTPGAESAQMWLYYIALVALAEIIFPLYDLSLTRLTALYHRRIRPRFRRK